MTGDDTTNGAGDEQVAALRGRVEQLRSALSWLVGVHYADGEYVPQHIRSALERDAS